MAKSLKNAVDSNVEKMKALSADIQTDLICEEVLNKLGVVDNLHKVSAKNVFDDKWRIDVWTQSWFEHACGPSYKIKHSYFCTIKENCISGCIPEILPEYK